MARRRFFVDEVHAGIARLAGDDAHHLTRVLRVEAGQKFEISDNQQVYLAEVVTARKDLVTFAIIENLAPEEPPVRITLMPALIRFERFELLVEKATELGVEAIVPLQTARTEKGLELAALKRLPRWNRIVREASEQSRRTHLAQVSEPARLQAMLGLGFAHRFFLDEDPVAPPILQALPADLERGAEFALLAGPEGGWTDRERAAMVAANWRPVSLGLTILKTETAVIAALAIVNAAWQARA